MRHETCEEVAKKLRQLIRVVGVVKSVCAISIGRLSPEGEVEVGSVGGEVVVRVAHEGGQVAHRVTHLFDRLPGHEGVIAGFHAVFGSHHHLELGLSVLDQHVRDVNVGIGQMLLYGEQIVFKLAGQEGQVRVSRCVCGLAGGSVQKTVLELEG